MTLLSPQKMQRDGGIMGRCSRSHSNLALKLTGCSIAALATNISYRSDSATTACTAPGISGMARKNVGSLICSWIRTLCASGTTRERCVPCSLSAPGPGPKSRSYHASWCAAVSASTSSMSIAMRCKTPLSVISCGVAAVSAHSPAPTLRSLARCAGQARARAVPRGCTMREPEGESTMISRPPLRTGRTE